MLAGEGTFCLFCKVAPNFVGVSVAAHPAGLQRKTDRIQPMSCRIRAILLLMVIMWQSVIAGSPLSATERADEFEHLALHAISTDHHHHADHSVHLEDSGGTAQHQHADGGLNTAGLLTTGWAAVDAFKPISPVEVVLSLAPAPPLDGLLRPPRQTA